MKGKRISHIKLGQLSLQILVVVGLAGAVTTIAVFPGLVHMIAPFVKKKRQLKKQAVEKNIDSMIRTGLIKRRVSKNGDITLELTVKGRWESGIRNIFKKQEKKLEQWDGKWRIVIFDIPEAKRNIRRELRRAVMLYGFTKLQQSVWVYPYPCDDFVKLVRSYLEIKKDVLYITADQIENDVSLRREYGLK